MKKDLLQTLLKKYEETKEIPFEELLEDRKSVV